MGKGLTGILSLQRKHLPDMQDWINGANLTVENSKKATHLQCITDYESSILEDPGAVVPHTGICAGGAGRPALPTVTKTLRTSLIT